MKHFFISSLALLFVFSLNLNAQETDKNDQMNDWMKYMNPGEMHELLARNVGTWKAEIRTFEDPSKPPNVTEGVSEYEMLLGGRFLMGKHNAQFGEMKMEGFEIAGYDNIKKKFFSSWYDNFGTGVLYQEGDYDPETKTIHLSGSTIDPSGKQMKVRQTQKIIDENNSYMEMYMIQEDGKEVKWMEMKSVKVKKN